MTPSSRLIALMLIGLPFAALPMLAGAGTWVLVLGGWLLLLSLVVFDIVALRMARPEVAVDVPSAVGVGGDVDLAVELTLQGKRSLFVTIRVEVDEPLEEKGDVAAALEPGTSSISLEVAAPTRGVGRVAALWARLTGPLGLIHRIERVPLRSASVKVVPNAVKVRNLAVQFFGSRQAGSLRLKRLGDGTELDSLEAYEPGMDLRQVDWKTSARHQALRVRRFRLERNQRIVVCLDSGRVAGDRIEGLERLDHAVHSALALSWIALKAGDLVGLHCYAAEPLSWLPPRAGMPQMRSMQEACARLSTRDEETNHVLGMQHLLTRLTRRTLVVVLTEIADPTTSELMIQQVGHLAQRHLVVLVALDDPVVTTSADKPPEDLEGLGRAVVAGSLMRDRERVLSRLRRAGVDIVNGPPNRAALDLLTRYIRLKRRRLLG